MLYLLASTKWLPKVPKAKIQWLFSLLIVSFVVQKLLSLVGSHLFIFILYSHYLRWWVKKDLAVIYARECSA